MKEKSITPLIIAINVNVIFVFLLHLLMRIGQYMDMKTGMFFNEYLHYLPKEVAIALLLSIVLQAFIFVRYYKKEKKES